MSNTYFTEAHELFRASLKDFLDKEVKPNIDEWEEQQQIPKSIWKKMGSLGFLGLGYPKDYGGSDLDFFYNVVFNEEIGKMNSGGFVITQQVVQYMSSPYILKYGSERLKQKYLPGIISGDLISCIGITEPGAGSDVQNIQTKAIKDESGDFYLVNGSKTFITNGVYGDFIVAVVKTNPEAGSAGISLLVIDRNVEGVSANKLKKLGWHASDTAELHFDNVKVPAENLIGEEGKGFYYLMNGLQLERVCFIPSSVSAMEFAVEQALQYMSEREAFGKSLNRFQVLRHRIAQLSSEIESLKAFSYYCADLYNNNIYDVKLCSMAKLLSTELHEKVATQCLQFYGGYGYMEDYPMARAYRDVRVGTIGGGSSEVMREIIAKMTIDEVHYKKAKVKTETKSTGNSISIFSEEHELFRESFRTFLQAEVEPNLDKWEKEGVLPRHIFKRFGEMGYFGLTAPETYGGSGLDVLYTLIFDEELAKINSGGFAASIGAHPLLAITHLNAEGSDFIKQKYLKPSITGELIGALAITEPFGGSDVQAIKTTAVKQGDHYIVNGSKTFITNGVSSDYIITAVKTDTESKSGGMSLLVIDRNLPGVSATMLDKLGWHASDTGEIAFDEVKVPTENLLGQVGQGFFYIMEHFVSERLSLAAGSYAKAEQALQLTIQYLHEREAFGRKLKAFQVLRHRIAQLSAEVECAKQFVHQLYARYSKGEYVVKEAAMAKLLTTQLCDKVTTQCLQMFGGYGYMESYPLARMFRDSRLGQIGGGTSEIMCEIIAKMMIEGKGYRRSPKVDRAKKTEKPLIADTK